MFDGLGSWIFDHTAGAATRRRARTESLLRARWEAVRGAWHEARIPISQEVRRIKISALGVKFGVVMLWLAIGAACKGFSGLIPMVFLVAILLAHWPFKAYDRLGGLAARWIWSGHTDLDPVRDKDVFNLEAELRAMQAAANIKRWEAMDPEARRAYAPDLLGSLYSLSSSRDFSNTWGDMETIALERLGGPTMPTLPAPAPVAEAAHEAGVVEVEILPPATLHPESSHEQ